MYNLENHCDDHPVHQRLLSTMDNCGWGRNEFCPQAEWTLIVELNGQ